MLHSSRLRFRHGRCELLLPGQLENGGESLLSGEATDDHNSEGDDDIVAESSCFSPGGTRHRRFSLPALPFHETSVVPCPVSPPARRSSALLKKAITPAGRK